MTFTRLGLVVAALIGISGSFLFAYKVISVLYPVGTRGTAAPLWASWTAYSIALIVSTAVTYICYRLIAEDRENTDKADGLDERENLPY